MARRMVALALWAYFGWFLAATLAREAGLPLDYAALGGVAMGAFALVDWRRRMAARSRPAWSSAVSE